MFSLVMGHPTAAECWLTLEVHLSPRIIVHAQAIRYQLRELKKSDNESMSDYVIKVRAMCDSLSSAGTKIVRKLILC